MVEKIIQLIADIPLEWQVLVLAMFPVTELRVAIPYGIAQGLSPYLTLVMAALGNLVIAMIVLILLEPVIQLMSRVAVTKQIINKLLEKTSKKGGTIAKYGVVGLTLFVAVPVPGTGVWTGSLLAHLFGFSFGTALLSLGGGVIISAIIVTFISIGMIEALGLSLPLVILIIIVLLIIFYLTSLFFCTKH